MRRKKPLVAPNYDFNEILSLGNMQEYDFLESDVVPQQKQFWT